MRSIFETQAIFALTQYHDSPYQLGKAFVIPNCSNLGHECDVLVISKKGYATEIELKYTLSDLKADAKKWHKHESVFIRQLYFGLHDSISLEDAQKHVPEHAGIIYFHEFDGSTNYRYKGFYYCRIFRKPKARKNVKPLDQCQINALLKTMYYRYYNLLFKERYKLLNETLEGASELSLSQFLEKLTANNIEGDK